MFKLLNRLAFFVSILFWFFITTCLFILWWELKYLGWDEVLIFILISVIIWMIFKKIFLKKKLIEKKLLSFAETLSKWYKKDKLKSILLWEDKNPTNYSYLLQDEEENEENTKINKECSVYKETKISSQIDKNEEEIMEKSEEKDDINEIKNITKQKTEEKNQDEPSKLWIYVKSFFAENLLAKIGWILVFLWMVFLMSLVWNQIHSVWKIIIGFTTWFSCLFTWVILDKKGYKWESRVLMWVWILINYLVILSWRYLIWENNFYVDEIESTKTLSSWILWTWITFLFLILNTILAIITSLLYKSKTILIFSFIFAYLNPLLIWESSGTPYMLVLYSMIISIWALWIWIKQKNTLLLYFAFILWNILFLIAPFSTETWWIVKLVFSAILWFLMIIFTYKSQKKDFIAKIFVGNYLFIILQLFIWWDIWILNIPISFITYMISIFLFFGVWIWLFLGWIIKNTISLFLLPVLIILWLMFSWCLPFAIPALVIVIMAYLFWFFALWENLSSWSKYLFFVVLWWFIFFVNSFLVFSPNLGFKELSIGSFLTLIIVAFIFLFTSYILSRRKDLSYLYAIWTIWTIMNLAPVVFIWNDLTFNTQLIAILSIIIFAISNIVLPFVNENLIKKWKNLINLIVWSIFWVMFISFQLFQYWDKYFPWVTLWFAFMLLAVVYFIFSSFLINKLWIWEVRKNVVYKNSILSYLFIAISVLSLSIALVFSNNPEIVWMMRLFEATILFYFFSQNKENKIFTMWMILFTIWTLRLLELDGIVHKYDFIFLIPFSIIAVFLILNVKILDFIKTWAKRISHDILHILCIWMLWFLLIKIIPFTWNGRSTLWIWVFVFIIWCLYAFFSSRILKIFFVVTLSFFVFYHLGWFNSIIYTIDNRDLSYLRVLQYFTTLILWVLVIIWNRLNKFALLNIFVNLIYAFYLIFILSFYVYDIFNTTFSVTFFWWIISSVLLFYGISSNKIQLRTLWLYILSGVLIKIFLYDVWYWIDDAISRIIAFIVIWVLLIIISIRYTKKYWNNLKWEFSLKNLRR